MVNISFRITWLGLETIPCGARWKVSINCMCSKIFYIIRIVEPFLLSTCTRITYCDILWTTQWSSRHLSKAQTGRTDPQKSNSMYFSLLNWSEYPGSPSRPLKEWVKSPKTIILVGIYLINNSKGRTYFNGRLDFQGICANVQTDQRSLLTAKSQKNGCSSHALLSNPMPRGDLFW